MAAFKITVLCFLTALVGSSAELLSAGKAEPFNRVLDWQPVARYQAGSLFARDSSLVNLWVERVSGDRRSIQIPISFPDISGLASSDVVVSFDGTIGASAAGTDRQGSSFAGIGLWRPDGSLIRVIRTTPFIARQISFTADGSVWAMGRETAVDGLGDESPVHDVLRRYAPDGEIKGSYLPRASLSTGWPHPSTYGLLVTSKERVGYVSEKAGKWAVLADDGAILGQGAISAPAGFRIYVAAITDSGRLFVSGNWRGKEANSPGKHPRIPVFEINPETGTLEPVEMAGAFPDGESANLLGAEGEDLVFKAATASGVQIKWMKLK
jgi:hypothetical protein